MAFRLSYIFAFGTSLLLPAVNLSACRSVCLFACLSYVCYRFLRYLHSHLQSMNNFDTSFVCIMRGDKYALCMRICVSALKFVAFAHYSCQSYMQIANVISIPYLSTYQHSVSIHQLCHLLQFLLLLIFTICTLRCIFSKH